MKIHVWSMGDDSLGELGRATRVNQEIEVSEADRPMVEITLANGATIQLRPSGGNSLEVMVSGRGAGGRVLTSHSASNVFEIITGAPLSFD